MSVSSSEFSTLLDTDFPEIANVKKLGVAISGGPDSMALAFLLCEYAQKQDKEIYAVTFDHDLREGSGDEALSVSNQTKDWPNFHHAILKWSDEKPQTRIMEQARKARYAAFAEYYVPRDIRHLFLGHHMDDQAETFLIRLSKGSGLDGLSGMRKIQSYEVSEGCELTFLRPLLNFEKDDLMAVCRDNNIDYSDDPSNENEHFLRPRLRASRRILEEEGLSAKRLANTARRLQSARDALAVITDRAYVEALTNQSQSALMFNFEVVKQWPYEVGLRLILKCIDGLGRAGKEGYGPRLEKVESLYGAILRENAILIRTLGGCKFTYDAPMQILKIEKE